MYNNLGAATVTTNTVSTLGLLYQWGRKDLFLGSSSTSDEEEPTIYNENVVITSLLIFRVKQKVSN